MTRTLVGLCLLLFGACAMAAPYDEALAARDHGDFASAFNTFQRLAQQGDAASQFQLSLLYASGRGVAPNANQAMQWLQRAAGHGNADAQSNLGVALASGRNVAQNVVKAYAWFKLAARAGNADAATNLRTLARRMNTQQVAAAEALFAQCQQGNLKACD